MSEDLSGLIEETTARHHGGELSALTLREALERAHALGRSVHSGLAFKSHPCGEVDDGPDEKRNEECPPEIDGAILDAYIRMLKRFREGGEPNLADVMATARGWLPLAEGEEMSVTFGGKKYRVKREALR